MTTLDKLSKALLAGAAAMALSGAATVAQAQTAAPVTATAEAPFTARNVILVHGAFNDASGYLAIVQQLQAAGLNVIAVQNPLTSLADDVASVRRALASVEGPTVLVGHSWGGVVISEAGNDPKVTALVYLAALAPEVGQNILAEAGQFPPSPGLGKIVAADGKAQLSVEGFTVDFAPDVPRGDSLALAAMQQPVAADLFGSTTTVAAWQTKPSFYAVATEDRMIAPDLQRLLSTRMKATTVELEASHALVISEPVAVADLIKAAARAPAQ